ncbi:hypothetical protein Hamer_G006863 [Homarus americanus]|uniref:Uncharacterized protein n=1 Tax=Homarus americanus TaxID=6706 RepID=A0A8J5N3S1_HOMAM|nr:hypothetical protein Hamer_G006863 [Homarus americanus]
MTPGCHGASVTPRVPPLSHPCVLVMVLHTATSV